MKKSITKVISGLPFEPQDSSGWEKGLEEDVLMLYHDAEGGLIVFDDDYKEFTEILIKFIRNIIQKERGKYCQHENVEMAFFSNDKAGTRCKDCGKESQESKCVIGGTCGKHHSEEIIKSQARTETIEEVIEILGGMKQYCHPDNFAAFNLDCKSCTTKHQINIALSDAITQIKLKENK